MASEAIRNATRGRVDADFADLGHQTVKNIEEAVQAYRLTPRAASAGASEATATWVRGAPWRRPARLGLAGGALCVVVATAWLQWNNVAGVRPTDADERGTTISVPIAADAGPLSLVVLPFANLTGDASQEFIAAGLTASITSDLLRIRDAFVISAATAKSFSAKGLTARQVGKELGVRYVLQGSVQRSGTHFRISAQLADAASDAQLWTDVFAGDSSDLFALQDQVTTRISTSMGRELVIRAARESEKHKGNPTSAELLLQIRGLELRTQSIENWQNIQQLYRQVLRMEPDNGAALAGLAVSQLAQVPFLDGRSDPAQFKLANSLAEEARRLAIRATTLDVNNSLAYRALAQYAAQNADFDEAVRYARVRLALEPRSQTALNTLAFAHYWRGEPQLSLPLLHQGLALDPKHPYEATLYNLAKTELMLGHYETAIDWSLKAQAANRPLGYRDPTLIVAYELNGNHAKAQAIAAAAVKSDPGFTISWLSDDVKNTGLGEYYRTTVIPAARRAGLPDRPGTGISRP